MIEIENFHINKPPIFVSTLTKSKVAYRPSRMNSSSAKFGIDDFVTFLLKSLMLSKLT